MFLRRLRQIYVALVWWKPSEMMSRPRPCSLGQQKPSLPRLPDCLWEVSSWGQAEEREEDQKWTTHCPQAADTAGQGPRRHAAREEFPEDLGVVADVHIWARALPCLLCAALRAAVHRCSGSSVSQEAWKGHYEGFGSGESLGDFRRERATGGQQQSAISAQLHVSHSTFVSNTWIYFSKE